MWEEKPVPYQCWATSALKGARPTLPEACTYAGFLRGKQGTSLGTPVGIPLAGRAAPLLGSQLVCSLCVLLPIPSLSGAAAWGVPVLLHQPLGPLTSPRREEPACSALERMHEACRAG